MAKILTGEIDLWIEMGLPSEKRVRKARAIAKQVIIFIYGGRTAQMWWDENRSKVLQHGNVKIIEISAEDSGALRDIAQRTMRLQCTIDEDSVWFSDDAKNIEIRLIEHC